jgi:exosome complex exonuclease DIS3/RRP44
VRKEVQARDARLYKRLLAVFKERASDYTTWVGFSNEHHRSTYTERQPNESAADYNDRAIRAVARWYAQHLNGKVKILLLTNGQESRAKVDAHKLKRLLCSASLL